MDYAYWETQSQLYWEERQAMNLHVKCEYCGRTNKRERAECKGCGAGLPIESTFNPLPDLHASTADYSSAIMKSTIPDRIFNWRT